MHESDRTRIARVRTAAGAFVLKEYLGGDSARRLRHEREILRRLEAVDGVVKLVDAPVADHALALQDCGDFSLASVLRGNPLPPGEVVRHGRSIALILAAIHRAGVVHRDICPANILLMEDGGAVLVDFDAAITTGESAMAASNDELVGTPGFLAPEQTGRTGRSVDARADLHGLGATLYALATGRPPFGATDALELIRDHLVREPAAPYTLSLQLPPLLSAVIMRLLAKDPAQRYQAADGLAHDLDRLGADMAAGVEPVFELGERDFPSRLAPPSRLLGREREAALLRAAFEDAMSSPRHTVLIEGAAGVGKSALIAELRPWVEAAGGWFVEGKYDQFHREATTAGGGTHAMRSLGRQLLTLPRAELAAHRERLLQALGRNAALVTKTLPEFAVLLGDQGEVATVDPMQAELSLLQATVDLLGAIATRDHPVVFALDDLQWAPAHSLRTFERLAMDSTLEGLLLVGAYRPGDAARADAPDGWVARWRELECAPVHIELRNLRQDGLAAVVGDMLRLPATQATRLAADVAVLSAGNPFDTVEVLNALRGDGILVLGAGGWQWDSQAIRRFVGQGSVLDLLAARIARLPRESIRLLECMACLGNSVDSILLGVAAGLSGEELTRRLNAPLEEGLLAWNRTVDEPVRFRHDRVQQAVLGRLKDAGRSDLQLTMARRIMRLTSRGSHAAQQFFGCTDLAAALHDARERRAVARMFHSQAGRLVVGANFALADAYLQRAGALLADGQDLEGDRELRWLIGSLHHQCLYSLGDLEAADPVFAWLEQHATDALDVVDAACMHIRSLANRGRMHDALELGLRLLSRLGVTLSREVDGRELAGQVDALLRWVDEVRDRLPPVLLVTQDARVHAMSRLINRMWILWPALFPSETQVAVSLLFAGQRLWLDYGPNPALVAGLSRAGVVLIHACDSYRAGAGIVRHVLGTGEAEKWELETAEARQVFAACSSHWVEPVEGALRHSLRAREALLRHGDYSYACYTYRVSIQCLLDCAPTLEAYAAEIDDGMALSRRTGNSYSGAINLADRQLLRALRGQTASEGSFADGEFDEAAYRASTSSLPIATVFYHVRRALCAAIFDDAAALASHTASAMPLLGCVTGYYVTVHAWLLRALALAAQIALSGRGADRESLEELATCRNWLAARAADQPGNFRHLWQLAEAEAAWAIGDRDAAAKAFDAALGEARTRNRPWQAAFIAERCGRFQLAAGLVHSGQASLAEACRAYEAWGATAKALRLRREHGFLRTPMQDTSAQFHAPASAASTDAVDLLGVLRASQALSSETSLVQLCLRVTEVLQALSGATRVLLLSWRAGGWELPVADAPHADARWISAVEAAEQGLLPLSAVRYAERTGEPLTVADATLDERFGRDPYFTGLPRCSLLVLPIASQGVTRALLYLESRHGAGAFHAQRLDAARLIAGQLAVSLANVQLYESLEQRVRERTLELEAAQAQLVAAARKAGMAQIANNVLHNVGNVLNSVIVSASSAVASVRNSRSSGLSRAVALMDENAGCLGEFMDHDPRGQKLHRYLQMLAPALAAEQHDIEAELVRLTRSVEHIKDIVSTQQSHAGASSVRQMENVGDLVDEALRINAGILAQNGVVPLRKVDDLPLLPLDKPRLLQILVNLIGNAAQAMRTVDAGARHLTLAAGITGTADRRLRISVRDEGEGIAADQITRIFSHGYTTKPGGHGFGLHSSAVAAMEMGGTLSAHSDGPGHGATFILEIPVGDPGAPS